MKYSLSGLSNPPVYIGIVFFLFFFFFLIIIIIIIIGPDMTEEWVHDRMPVVKRFASTIIMTLVVSIVIFTVVVFIIVTLAYMKQRHYQSM